MNGKPEPERVQVWIAVLGHVNQEIVARRQPEYIFIGAGVAAFGALAWGVAAIGDANSRYWPALVSGFGTLLLAAGVLLKVCVEHGHYERLRGEQVKAAQHLAAASGVDLKDLPWAYQNAKAGKGHLWSILILELSAVASALFAFVYGEAAWQLTIGVPVGFGILSWMIMMRTGALKPRIARRTSAAESTRPKAD